MTRSKLYLALQAVVCIGLVILLSLSAISIYREGSARKAEHPMESVYTPGDVAGRFAPIAPLLFAGLGLLVAGLVLGVKDENAEKPVKDALFFHREPKKAATRPRQACIERQSREWDVHTLCQALGVSESRVLPVSAAQEQTELGRASFGDDAGNSG